MIDAGPTPAEVKDQIVREITQVHLQSYGQPVENIIVELGSASSRW
jgi:phenylpyruvate tautomerase PptA (4-oxalocrotonate tautomerase family)